MFLWRPSLVLPVLVALSLTGFEYASAAGGARQNIVVHVDSMVASNTHEGIDGRLAPMGRRLEALFNYSTYRLVSRQDSDTQMGKMVSFDLPGGRILHVRPQEVDGSMIAMELVLFEGERPLMTTELKLRDHGILIVGGPRYEQGMLIITICAETVRHLRAGNPKAAAAAAAAVP